MKISFWVFSACLLLLGSSCSVHPEAESGPDGYRDTATPIEFGEWIPDQVSTNGDRSDWRSFELEVPESLQVALLVPANDASVSVGIYEVHGMLVAETNKPGGVGKNKTVFLKKALHHGRYYIRIRAHDGGDIAYSLRVDLGEFATIPEPFGGGSSFTDLPSDR
jgi:hypothetical protein